MLHLAAALWMATAQSALAGDAAIVVGSAVNLRQAPEGKVVMHLPYGTPCEVVAKAPAEPEWVEVELPQGQHGYLHRKVLAMVPTERPEADRAWIARAKMAIVERDSAAETHLHSFDDDPDPTVGLDSFLASDSFTNAFERATYWDADAVPLRYRIRMFEILGTRTRQEYGSTYASTPVEVLVASGVYTLPEGIHLAPVSEDLGPAGHRHLELPPAAPSIFEADPGEVLALAGHGAGDTIGLSWPLGTKSRPATTIGLVQVMRASLPAAHGLHLEREGRRLLLRSDVTVHFISAGSRGGGVIVHTARLEYELAYPGTLPQEAPMPLRLTHVEPPVDGDMILVLAQPEVIARIGQNATFSALAERRALGLDGAPTALASTLAIDFDGDQVPDLLRSNEDCPEEAGDSHDLFLHTNVGGTWTRQLVWRTWCNP